VNLPSHGDLIWRVRWGKGPRPRLETARLGCPPDTFFNPKCDFAGLECPPWRRASDAANFQTFDGPYVGDCPHQPAKPANSHILGSASEVVIPSIAILFGTFLLLIVTIKWKHIFGMSSRCRGRRVPSERRRTCTGSRGLWRTDRTPPACLPLPCRRQIREHRPD
jgi:hypothetical protein